MNNYIFGVHHAGKRPLDSRAQTCYASMANATTVPRLDEAFGPGLLYVSANRRMSSPHLAFLK